MDDTGFAVNRLARMNFVARSRDATNVAVVIEISTSGSESHLLKLRREAQEIVNLSVAR
jgi:hypothetical protein